MSEVLPHLREIDARFWRRQAEHEKRYAEDPDYRAQKDDERAERLAREELFNTSNAWDRYLRTVDSFPRRHQEEVARIPWSERSIMWKHLSELWTGREQVIMAGPEGCGKTTAMVWAGEWTAVRCKSCEYVSATMFAPYAKSDDKLEDLKHCNLLLIDECHRMDALPDWILSVLIGLIDFRYYEKAAMIMAGTVPPDRLVEIVGVEIVKRFEHRIVTKEKSYRNGRRT